MSDQPNLPPSLRHPWPDVQPWDHVIATFIPKHQETLRPELQKVIGVVAEFCCSWIIDEEDGGPYVGQGAFHTEDKRFHGFWVPSEDLENVQLL